MKRLILLALTLTACAPALQLAQREQASLKRDGLDIVFVNPGPGTAEDVAVLLTGPTTDLPAVCQLRGSGRVGCTLGDVPEGQQYRLSFKQASTSGSSTHYRASAGIRPIYLELP